MTPEEQAAKEWAEVQRRRAAIGQSDRPWNTTDAGKEWVKARIVGIKKEREQ